MDCSPILSRNLWKIMKIMIYEWVACLKMEKLATIHGCRENDDDDDDDDDDNLYMCVCACV